MRTISSAPAEGPPTRMDTIAFFEKTNRDRVENLVERRISDALRSGGLNERQRQPLTDDRHVAGAKERQSKCLHEPDVACEEFRLVTSAGPVGAGDQNLLCWLEGSSGHNQWYSLLPRLREAMCLPERPPHDQTSVRPHSQPATGRLTTRPVPAGRSRMVHSLLAVCVTQPG